VARYDPERPTYAAAASFVDAALRQDDSLFTPGRPIWSLVYLQELDRLPASQPRRAASN
jgi:hypothetical protein